MLKEEWALLQKQYENYEFGALTIKLAAFILTVIFFLTPLRGIEYLALMLALWLTEGIWKTYQDRLTSRLLRLEQSFRQGDEDEAMRLHSRWQESRGGHIELVHEYLTNSCKPTVAFPYAVLIMFAIIL